jgi:signal transduction histidine kinase
MVGEDIFEYVHPEDREEIVSTFEEDVENPDGLVRLEYRFRNADGEYRVVESVGRNLLDTPAVGGLVVNSRDVTDRVERERELEAKNARLDEFASLVSHDLRNPLGVAQGYLDVAAEDPETYLPEVRTSLDRMEAIVDDVLALSRGSDPVEDTERVDIGAVARRGWDQVDTGGATLSLDDSGTLDADPDRLQQLLENLFRNSVEHAGPAETADGPSGPTVTVGTTDAGFYVADDGPGIPESEREAVFDVGYSTADDGTGLGLRIVRQIAEAHGWTVSVTESEAGGARFEFTGVDERWAGTE